MKNKPPLELRYLHLPRSAQLPQAHWELSRGFRLRVVEPHVLVLTLGAASATASDPLARAPASGEESLVLLPAPRGPDERMLEKAIELPRDEDWCPAAVLLLSDPRQLGEPIRKLERALRPTARSSPWLVVWVLQEMPDGFRRGLDFFNVERVLHQLGRISRRIQQRMTWRRRLPW
ncbi:MAG: hypothetical protein HY319_10115 [Armatimonadetes bacterium]|nr:hypothetical protein [Armatimonadota bacterium]